MLQKPSAHLERIQECAAEMLEGTSGPLGSEQKELLRVVFDHARRLDHQCDLIECALLERAATAVIDSLRSEFDALLRSLEGYTELVQSGATGALTPTQCTATHLILMLTQRLREWSAALYVRA